MIGQLIDTVLLAAHHQDFGKIMVGLIALIHTDGFNGVLGFGQEEEPLMMKGKLKDGKKQSIDLKRDQSA